MSDTERLHALLDEANASARRALASIEEAKRAIFGEPQNDNPTTRTNSTPATQQSPQNNSRAPLITLKNNPLQPQNTSETTSLDDL